MTEHTIQHTTCERNGDTVSTLLLENRAGIRLTVSNFGASILSLEVPDANGNYLNIVVGLESIIDYIEKHENKISILLGATVGRFAGRISTKELSINNKQYAIHHENGVHLHGGKNGFDSKVWLIKHIDEENLKVSFEYKSQHLEEGYPGNLLITATYQLNDANELKISYKAICDRDTIVNLTNHAYFNLDGEGSITNHLLQVESENYLETNSELIPTGIIKSVENTSYDYRRPIKLDNLVKGDGLDNTFIFNESDTVNIILKSPQSKITMEVFTDQPGAVIYTPINLPKWDYLHGVTYTDFPAICFENQKYPDAPNNSHFPSTFLKAGEVYENTSVFKFGIDR